jgi:TolA-binding protein
MLAVAPSSTTANNFNDLGLADSFYSQKDYADAYDLYAQFAKEHPESPAVATALYRAGESLYRQKFYSQAIGAWQNLLTSKPGTPEAIKASYQIGDTLFRSARYEEAEGVYDKILAANPKDAQAPFVVLRLAQIAYYRKDDDKAFARVRELATRFPEAVEVNAGLDLAEAASERSPKSDLGGLINAVVAANPKSPAAAQAQFRLAQSRFDAKKYPEAATLFQRFSVEHVGDAMLAKAQLLLGESYFFAKDYARCIPVYERYVESYASTKEAPLALFHLGSAYYSLKQYDKMIAPFKKIIRSYPTSEYVDLARFNIALAYQQSGALDDAIASYNAYIKVATSTDQMVGALWNLFDIQQKKGSAAGGIAVLRRIVEVTKGTGAVACEASYKIGELQKATGDEAGAVRSWAATTKIRPLSSPYRLQALIQLSKVYEKNQDFSKAYDVYSDLAKNGDSDPELMKAARARAREIGAALPRGKR